MLKELEQDNLIYDKKNDRLGTVVKLSNVGADVWWHDRPKGKLERINNFDDVVKRNDEPAPISPEPFKKPAGAGSTPTRSKMVKVPENNANAKRMAASGNVLQDIRIYCEEIVRGSDLNNKPSLERIRDALNILERIQRG